MTPSPAPMEQSFPLTIGSIVTNGVPAAGAGNLESPGSTDVYSFEVTAGQVLYFHDLDATAPIDWALFDGKGVQLFRDRLDGNSPGRVQFAGAGTCRLVVLGAGDEHYTGTYSFEVREVSDQSFNLTIAQVVTNGVPAAGAGNLESPGTHDTYSFEASAGQVLFFHDLGATAPIDWELIDSTKEILFRDRLDGFDPRNVTLARGGAYTLVVFAAGDGHYTGTYSFQVLPAAPVIITQPQTQAVAAGRSVTFSVSTRSELPVRYQWRFNGADLPGQIQSTLILLNVQASQAGDYSVLAINDTDATLSQPAHLSLSRFISVREAARSTLPQVPGNGVAIELFNGIGGGSPPSPDLLQDRTPDGRTLSPIIDFPHPGQVINVGNSFEKFFSDTTTPPDGVLGLQARNFVLRNTFFLRVSNELDQNRATPEIDFQIGVGSDDGFHLSIGTNFVGSTGDRAFNYSWMPVSFEAEGLYPITLLYSANATGQSGLEFSWNTAASGGAQIIPQGVLYQTPDIGDRLITFEEFPPGTILGNQFAGQGVLFETVSGGLQVTTNFPGRFVPVSPSHVFGDPTVAPGIRGEVQLKFVVPGSDAPAVTDFLSFFVLNARGIGTDVTAFDTAGSVIFTNSYHGGGASQELVTIAHPRIARVRITLGQGTDTSAIDNLSFTTPVSGADLVPGGVTAPTLAGPGEVVTLTWAVTNIGITTVTQPWTDQLVLSGDPPGGIRVVLASVLQTHSLAPGEFLVTTQSVTVPVSGPSGLVHFGVRVDVLNDVRELNELNNSSYALNATDLPNWLSLQLAAAGTPEGGPPVRGTLFRNGDLSVPLAVLVTNSQPGKLQAPLNLVLAAGQAAVEFEVRGLRDGVVDGARLVELAVGAPGYIGASATITVADVDKPRLSLQLPNTPVPEGTMVRGTVSRDVAAPVPLNIFLSVSGADAVTVPFLVTIPASAKEASFDVLTLNDQVPTPARTVAMTASAAGYQDSPPVVLTISESDLPALGFIVTKSVISEGDGPQATVGTVTRDPAGAFELTVELQSGDTNAVQVPSRIIIPAGQSSASFPISAMDNTVEEPAREVTLTAFVIQRETGIRLTTGARVKLTVTDNDGPSLHLTLRRRLVGKGFNPATTATLTRTGPLAQPLTVSLNSSDSGEATVPSLLTLASGEAATTVQIASANDGLPGTSHRVTIAASASGYSPASDTLVVSDLLLPDLIVTDLSGPATADTEAFVNVSYRIVNQGFAAASTNISTRIFLSQDTVVGNDILAGDFQFTGTLPPGQFFEQTLQVRMPTVPGDYWLVVSTDVEDRVPEILKDNNTTIATVPVHVREAYTAVVTVDVTTARTGIPIRLHGRAFKADSAVPAPNVPVHVHLWVRGTDRVLLGVTDEEGNFSISFNPLPNEAGRYAIAAAHPGVANPSPQAHFTIAGLRARIPDQPVKVIALASQTLDIVLENLSEVPLSGLQAKVISQPANVSARVRVLADGKLPGSGTSPLEIILAATDAGIRQGTVLLQVSSAEGAGAEVAIPITIESLQSRLVFLPNELEAGMKPGSQAVVEFEVTNPGGTATGPITVLAPDLPWLTVASANPFPGLAPGQTNRITLQLRPPAGLPLGGYSGALVLRAGDLATSLPFRFRALGEAKGDLRITAVDEYTYYADGSPPVTNAVVVVRDAVSRAALANGVTDQQGQFVLPQLLEGYYDVEVTADNHIGYRGTTLVRPGLTNDLQAFLSRETVHYTWTVVPVEIEDRTRITIETTFETFVPIPVVTIEPNVIDLAGIKADVTQIDLRISNHGLIAANNFRLGFGSHPDWQFEPLISEVGALPARSSLVIPLTIRRLSPRSLRIAHAGLAGRGTAALQGGGGPCGIFGGGSWTLVCGTVKTYSTPILILNAGAGCGGGGGGTWGGNGSGGAPFVSGPSFPFKVDCNTNNCKELNLPEINLSGILKPAAKVFDKFANAYLDKNLWNVFLGLEVETEPEAKGRFSICCTNNVPKEQITAELGGEVKLTSNKRNIKIPISETIPDFQLGGMKGTLQVEGSAFLGTAAQPAFKISGSYKSGCGRDKPELEVSISGSVTLKSGLFGEVKAKFEAPGFPGAPLGGKSEIKGGIEGKIEFTYTLSSEGKSKFCYKSEGLYLEAKASLFGIPSVDLFPPNGKYYLIKPLEVCDPPAGLAGAPSLDELAGIAMRQVEAELAARSPDFARLARGTPSLAQADDAGGGGAGVCAQVRLKLDQDLVLTRNAFNATLELVNNDPSMPLEDISIRVNVLKANRHSAEGLFDIRTNQWSGITAVDGTGVVAASSTGKASWILIPTSGAAPDQPTDYLVSGVLSYRQGGRHIVVPFTPVPINVQPDPRLEVRYFHQRDVFSDDPFTPVIEPSVPFSLAVMVRNRGKGVARNVRITSSQPRIVDNEKGLLVDFKIIGTEVAGHPATPSLSVDYGTINPGEISIGRWLLTSTLQGLFVDYKATIEHTAGPQDRKTSLVDEVSIHEMTHLVQAQGALDDGKPDFLVNDEADPEALPDTLYLSDGSTNRVNVVRQSSLGGPLSRDSLGVQLTASMPPGWAYLQVPDPGQGQFKLLRVVRSDGVEISMNTNVWTTDRTFIGQGRKPLNEHVLHLLDYNSTGNYTLSYGPPTPVESEPPSSQVARLPADSYQQIPVTWSGADNPGGSGIGYYDIYVSVNGGTFSPWLQHTVVNGAVYDGRLGNTYAFYSVATDNAGNREAAPLTPDATTRVTRENHAPVLAPVADQSVNEGDLFTVTATASDPDGDALTWSLVAPAPAGVQIDPWSGLISWLTAKGLGPSTHQITVQVLDDGIPRLGSLRRFLLTIAGRNSPPELGAIPNQRIVEGQLLVIANRAVDPDFPPQHLRFELGPGAPAGAGIDPQTGVFSWRPDEFQGGTNYVISVIVTDDGTPVSSATQTFQISVLDTRADFGLSIGSTNTAVGTSNSVPIILRAHADLTNLVFQVGLPASRLGSFSLEPAAAEVGGAVFTRESTNRARIQIIAAQNQVLPSEKPLARLRFITDQDPRSEVLLFGLSGVSAVRSTGKVLRNATVRGGRVFLVGHEPLLDARLVNGQRQLVLYPPPLHSYEIQFRTNLLTGADWSTLSTVFAATDSIVISDLGQLPPPLFYRAIQTVTRPALGVSGPQGSGLAFLLRGEPGQTYVLQSKDSLGSAVWTERMRITPTNPVQRVEGLILNRGTRFYRVVAGP